MPQKKTIKKKIKKEIETALAADDSSNVQAVYQTDWFKKQLNGKVKRTTSCYYWDDERVKNRNFFRKEVNTYNRLGFITESEVFDKDNQLFEKRIYEYDSLRLIKVTENDSQNQLYRYDEKTGQIKEIILAEDLKKIPTYNKKGLVCHIEYENGTGNRFNYFYDLKGRLVKEEWYENAVKFFSTDEYFYDSTGQLYGARLYLGKRDYPGYVKSNFNSSDYEYSIREKDLQNNWTSRLKTIRANGVGYEYHERTIEYF